MLMSVPVAEVGAHVYGELAGTRVLVTGLSASCGVDLARALAEHKARLILQTADVSDEMAALAAVLAEEASEIKLYNDAVTSGDAAVKLAQKAAAAFGGLDVAINIVTVTRADVAGRASIEDIEDLVSEKLLAATLVTRVAANRMRLTMNEGLVLNIVRTFEPATAGEIAVCGILRAALATMTRSEAAQWAGEAIRINAIGPRSLLPEDPPGGAALASEPDIAALTLYLASKKGRKLSGHVFDAEGVAGRDC